MMNRSSAKLAIASLAAVMLLAGCGQNADVKSADSQVSEQEIYDSAVETVTSRGITLADLTDLAVSNIGSVENDSVLAMDLSCINSDLVSAMELFKTEDAWRTYCGYAQMQYMQKKSEQIYEQARQDAEKLNQLNSQYREWSGQSMTWDEFKQAHPDADPGQSSFDSSSMSNEEYFDYMQDYYGQDSGCSGLSRSELTKQAMDAYPDLSKVEALNKYAADLGCEAQ